MRDSKGSARAEAITLATRLNETFSLARCKSTRYLYFMQLHPCCALSGHRWSVFEPLACMLPVAFLSAQVRPVGYESVGNFCASEPSCRLCCRAHASTRCDDSFALNYDATRDCRGIKEQLSSAFEVLCATLISDRDTLTECSGENIIKTTSVIGV